MRTPSAAQAAILASPTRATHFRIKVLNAAGNDYADLSNFYGHDWIKSVEYGEDIDSPVSSCTVTLWRARGILSLATFMQGSAVNRPAGSYVPAIDISRLILIESAVQPAGMPVTATTEWILGFAGFIDEIDFGGSGPTIQLRCRDEASTLVDTFIETVRSYGSTAGTAVETVMQSIITDNINTPGLGPLGPIYLYSINSTGSPPWNPADSPGFLIKPYNQGQMSVWDALLALATMIGWDLRYRITNAGYRWLTMYDPQRAKTTPDATLDPALYFEASGVTVGRQNIRNVVRVRYPDSATGRAGELTVSNSASITRYGRRFMQISEGQTSQIDTSAEATALATAALSDLKEPTVAQSISAMYNPFIQLTDLIRCKANGVHYDTDQDVALTTIRHGLSRDRCVSEFGVRGKPSSGYRRWLGIGSNVVDVPIGDNVVGGVALMPSDTNGNVIPNSSFEENKANEDTSPPDGWTIRSVGTVYGAAGDVYYSTTSQSGGKSLLFRDTSPAADPVVVSRNVPVLAGMIYRARMLHYKSVASATIASFFVEHLDATFAVLETTTFQVGSAATTWLNETRYLQMNASAKYARFGVAKNRTVAGTVYIDEVELSKADPFVRPALPSSQALGAAGTTIVHFGVSAGIWSNCAYWNDATYNFTLPASSKYNGKTFRVDGQILCQHGSGAYLARLDVYVNGALLRSGADVPLWNTGGALGYVGQPQISAAGIQLFSGDVLDLRITHTDPTGMTIAAGNSSTVRVALEAGQ